jgi:hypothetical protein
MKKNSISAVIAAAVIVMSAACESDKTYQGPPQIAFASKTLSVSVDTDKVVKVPVQLIADGAMGDITAGIAVNAASTLASGAVQMPSQVTIPAGRFTADLSVSISYSALDSIKTLKLDLSSDVKVAANYASLTITFTKVEPTIGFAAATLNADVDTNTTLSVVVNMTRPGGAMVAGDVSVSITEITAQVNGVDVPTNGVTIPTGKLRDTLKIPVTYASLPNTTKSTIKLVLTTTENRLKILTDTISIVVVKKYPTISFTKAERVDSIAQDSTLKVGLKITRVRGMQGFTASASVVNAAPAVTGTISQSVGASDTTAVFDVQVYYDALESGKKNVVILRLSPPNGVKAGAVPELTLTLYKKE